MPSSTETLKDIAVRLNRGKIPYKSAEGNETKEKTLLIVGSKGVGKTSLIYKFLDRDETPKHTLALDYTFGRKSGKSLEKDVCHIWELGGGTVFSSLLSTPLRTSHISQLTVVVMLDLASPQSVWFTLETVLHNILNALRQTREGTNLSKDLKILQEKAWDRVGRDNPDKDFMDPFPIPLVIIGGKYDIFQDFDPEKKKVVCRCLRYVAHTLGASLQFYSLKDTGLVKKVKDVLGHHAFDGPPVKSISQDYNKPLLIPAGSDSMEQIGGSGTALNKGPGSALERWRHIFTKHFPQETSERSVIPEDPAKDLNFREPDIDALRAQKDDELERYRQEVKRRQKHFFDSNNSDY